MKGIVYGIFFSLVFWGLFLFAISFAKADEYDCLLIGKGTIEIDSEIVIEGENFTSWIQCNVISKRRAIYLGGPWCIGRKVRFQGVKSRKNKIYTCLVKNFTYDEAHTAN